MLVVGKPIYQARMKWRVGLSREFRELNLLPVQGNVFLLHLGQFDLSDVVFSADFIDLEKVNLAKFLSGVGLNICCLIRLRRRVYSR